MVLRMQSKSIRLNLKTLDLLYEDYLKEFQHERFSQYVTNRVSERKIFAPIIDDYLWNEKDASVAYLGIKRLIEIMEKVNV